MKKITRKEQALQTEQGIIQAIQLLVQTKTFQEIQIKDICAEVGISNGNFYHYFPNKNSLIIRLLQDYEKDFSAIVKDTDLSLKDQLVFVFTSYAEMIQNIGKDLIIELHTYQLATKNNILLHPDHPLFHSVSKILNSLLESGDILVDDNTEEITNNMIIVFRGFVFEWVMSAKDYNFINEIQKQMTRYIYLFVK